MKRRKQKKGGALLPGAKAKSPCLSAHEQIGGTDPSLFSMLFDTGDPNDHLRQDHDEQKQRAVDQRLQIMTVHSTTRITRIVRTVGNKGKGTEGEGQTEGMIDHHHPAIDLRARDRKQAKSKQRADQGLQRAPSNVQKEQPYPFYDVSDFAHNLLFS